MTIFFAAKFAIEIGFLKIVLERDCLNDVNLLRMDDELNSEGGVIVGYCW